jgi:hypothetical protein
MARTVKRTAAAGLRNEEGADTRMRDLFSQQRDFCARHGTHFVESPRHLMVGLARNVGKGIWPLNGLRHPPQGDTSGWYIWSDEESSEAPDFFAPVHVSHLLAICPETLTFLGLPPGWRFLYAPGQEDVWQDQKLLDV